MATVAVKARRKFGNGYQIVADVTFSDSYTTGGETLNGLGIKVVDAVIASPAGGYMFEYVPSTGKLKAFDFDFSQAAAAPASEVAGATDLSTVTTRVIAVGY